MTQQWRLRNIKRYDIKIQHCVFGQSDEHLPAGSGQHLKTGQHEHGLTLPGVCMQERPSCVSSLLKAVHCCTLAHRTGECQHHLQN